LLYFRIAVASGLPSSGFYLRSQRLIHFGCIQVAGACLPIPGYLSKHSAFLGTFVYCNAMRVSDAPGGGTKEFLKVA
jgi:hypothetical protein